ncbi:hypothetical protein L9F63_016312, partial [Diploptera punctata]
FHGRSCYDDLEEDFRTVRPCSRGLKFPDVSPETASGILKNARCVQLIYSYADNKHLLSILKTYKNNYFFSLFLSYVYGFFREKLT